MDEMLKARLQRYSKAAASSVDPVGLNEILERSKSTERTFSRRPGSQRALVAARAALALLMAGGILAVVRMDRDPGQIRAEADKGARSLQLPSGDGVGGDMCGNKPRLASDLGLQFEISMASTAPRPSARGAAIAEFTLRNKTGKPVSLSLGSGYQLFALGSDGEIDSGSSGLAVGGEDTIAKEVTVSRQAALPRYTCDGGYISPGLQVVALVVTVVIGDSDPMTVRSEPFSLTYE